MQLIGEDLTCERGGRVVFSGLGFSASAGMALLLTGPNGSGKSSLLRLIAGFVPAAAGTVRLTDIADDDPVEAHCHYCGHLDALKPSLTVSENLTFWQRWFGRPTGDVFEALETMGIDHLEDLPAAYLSAGQRRRLSLARLLVSHRPVWLLDEPTSALDAASEAKLTGLMRAHLADGGLLIAATHLPLDLGQTEALRLGAAPSEAMA